MRATLRAQDDCIRGSHRNAVPKGNRITWGVQGMYEETKSVTLRSLRAAQALQHPSTARHDARHAEEESQGLGPTQWMRRRYRKDEKYHPGHKGHRRVQQDHHTRERILVSSIQLKRLLSRW